MTYTNELKIAAALCRLAGLFIYDCPTQGLRVDESEEGPALVIVRHDGTGLIELAHHLKWALGFEEVYSSEHSWDGDYMLQDESNAEREPHDGTALGEAAALIRLMGRVKGVEL